MTHLFVFGTLRHAALLEVVAGTRVATQEAALPDHHLAAVKDEVFPILRPEPGAVAEGILLQDLSQEAMARLDFYESLFDYRRQECVVRTQDEDVATQVYFPPDGAWTAQGAWDFDDWAATHGALTTKAAEEIMARRNVTDPVELARLYPFILARAWTHLMATATPAPTTRRRRAKPGDVVVESERATHEGFFRFKTFDVAARQFQGDMGPMLSRECFIGYDAALVLPYDPVRDVVLMVEQLRFGPLLRQDTQPWTLEPIAGIVDAGEDPQAAARREAQEEAGLTLTDLLPIAGIYPAPGYVTEYHHCFLGLTTLTFDDAGIGGLVSESENIRSHVVPFEEALDLIDTGEINIGPLVMMLLWLARHRPRLRSATQTSEAT